MIPYSQEAQAQIESAKALAVVEATFVIALMEKGLLTDEDIQRARMKAVHIVDQLFQQIKEQKEAEFLAENPNMAKFLQMIDKDEE